MNDPLLEWLNEVEEKEQKGLLTFREAPFGCLKLTSGKHEGRVVVKTHPMGEVDGEKVTWFAKQLTWIRVRDIAECTCKRVSWGEN